LHHEARTRHPLSRSRDGLERLSARVFALKQGDTAKAFLLTVLLAFDSGVCLFRFRVNSAWLVLGGALVGLSASWFRS
jgi:hypothetical protein